MYDRGLTKVNKAELDEVIEKISKLQVDEELSKAIRLQRQLHFYYQTRKELRDSCCFVNVHIQSGKYDFTKKLDLMIDNLIYYVRDDQLSVCTFSEETMTIEKRYNYSSYAHPLLLKKWYDHLNSRHYFAPLKNFLSFYEFDEEID